jgi:kynurenine formamidase
MTQAADTSPKHLSRDEFAELMHRLRGSAGWDATDRRGALNHLTPAHRIAAAAEVRLGQHVTLARPIETESAADDPEPPRHDMTGAVGDHHLSRGVDFAMDRFSMDVHGNATSHIDALCHVIWDSKLYNDVPVDVVTPEGATSLSIDVIRDGIVGRGVLLDIPRLRGTPWLEPGDDVTIAELRDAEQAEGVLVGPGDLLFVRVGHGARREQLGAWDAASARAGLHPNALEFVAERKVAALGSDGNNDTAPSAVDGVDFPVHALAMNALGLHLMDYLQFEDLAPMCEAHGRWTFLAVVAPLRLPHATGSPVNPIAIL